MLSREWQEKLTKAGFASILSLAVHTPIAYRDTRLTPRLHPGKYATFHAKVLSIRDYPGRMEVFLQAQVLPHEIVAVIFHPKPYHKALFKPNITLLLHGRIERFNGRLQIINPQKLSKAGDIVPQYRTKMRQDSHRRLVAALVTEANLVGEGLDSERAKLIVAAHHPDGRWLHLYQKHGGFGPRTIEALKCAEAIDYFKRMGKKRRYFEAIASLHGTLEPFIQNLPFFLTAGQQKAIAAIRADLASKKAARRMVVGDVGSGKTMVILAAAVIAYPHRAILMAPTSILAHQLYEEAKRWLPSSIDVALITQSKEEGKIEKAHLVVGTHALLYRDLPDAALVMVDEQHRFGTEQRKRLEKLVRTGKKRPHYLQFSATPIPRTQALIDSALIDVSLIEGTPFVKDITTRVIGRNDVDRLLDHIKKEISEDRQALVIYPLVEESEHFAYKSLQESESFWKRHFEGVFITHGKDREKEEVLQRFAKEGKILLSTTVMEVGISLPKLSTIVIVGPERMGLATLHQLRGRVSRTGLKGYCYLFTRTPKSQRLVAFAKTLDGFEIARLDLKFRQSGDLLEGKNQHGKRFVWLDMAEDEEIVMHAKELLKKEGGGGTRLKN